MKWLVLCLLFLIIASPAQASKSVEAELCFQKIKRAYERSNAAGGQPIIEESCLQYKEYYDFKYRGVPITYPRIVFIGAVLAPVKTEGWPMATKFSVSHVYDGPDVETVTIHHAGYRFEFFPGEHLIVAYKNKKGEFVNKGLSDGEIISDTEANRRAEMKLYYEGKGSTWETFEKERCIQKIGRAYDTESFTMLDLNAIGPECVKYLSDYYSRYKVKVVQE